MNFGCLKRKPSNHQAVPRRRGTAWWLDGLRFRQPKFIGEDPEIFPSDGGANLAANTPAHRLDEFPAGYSLAGCAPAEPTAASPADHHFAGSSFRRTMSFHRTASCGLTGCLSRGVHSNVIVYNSDTAPLQVVAVLHGKRDLKEIL